MKKYLLLIIISIIALGSFIFSNRVTPTSASCPYPNQNCWVGAIDCGTQCCNCTGGTQKCCYYGCDTSCGPVCVTRSATTYTIPFSYSQGSCGSTYTITTLPFSTNLGTYYTLPATYSYTGQ